MLVECCRTSDAERASFTAGQEAFADVNSVTGSVPGTEGGLGRRFNLDSCGGCHVQPGVGGTSPAINPQLDIAKLQGADNTVPFSLSPRTDPVREARFKRNPDGSPTGGVHALFVISGRSDAPSCSIRQPDFNRDARDRNLTFRTPTPVFGAGLIQSISDAKIIRNKNADLAKRALGSSRGENREGSAGTISRFGSRAQNKSLELFSAEAYNVEQGVTTSSSNRSAIRRTAVSSTCCLKMKRHSTLTRAKLRPTWCCSRRPCAFSRHRPRPPTSSTTNGQRQFNNVGCSLCHTPTLTTADSGSDVIDGKS
jgi:CxxC motif-containing protein (DUF1111 family)